MQKCRWNLSLLAGTLVASVFATGVVLANPPRDIPAAEALFRRGREELLASRFDTGCPALAESHRLDPRPGTLFTLAECEAKAGRIATALAYYEDFMAFVARLPEPQRLRESQRLHVAEEQRQALSLQVPQLTLTLAESAPPGTVVTRDGVALGTAALGVPLPINPGEHLVVAHGPDATFAEKQILIERGEKKQLVLHGEPRSVANAPLTAKRRNIGHSSLPAPLSAMVPVETAPPQSGATVLAKPTSETWGTLALPLSLAIGGAAALLTGGVSLFVGARKVQSIEDDGAQNRPYRESNGDYRDYQTAGAILFGMGSAALLGAGLLVWHRQWVQRSPITALTIRSGVSQQVATVTVELLH